MSTRLAAATQTLAGAAVMITAVTILSRLLGFVRTLTQAQGLGTGGVANAYAVANVLPNVLFEVAAGGALAGAVVPLLAGPLLRRARVDVDTIASALLTWTVVVLVPLGILLAALARPIVDLLPGLSDSAQADAATMFLRVFAVQVPLYGIGVVLSGVLQANRKFFWPAAAPMFSSVVVIVVYLVFGHLVDSDVTSPAQVSSAALALLAWGTTAGVAAMSLPLLVPALRTGLRLRPTFTFPAGVGAKAGRLVGAGIGALVAQQVSVLAVMVSALRHGGDTAFNVYQYSQAVYLLPYAVLAVPLATSAFPRLAARADAGDTLGFARLSAVATRAVVAVSAVGVVALVAAAPAVETFFAGFTRGRGVEGMAASIAWSAPGLVGFALLFHLTRSLYSLDSGRSAVVSAAVGWFTAAVLALVLPAVAGADDDPVVTLASIGAASSVGMLVAAALLLVALRRRAGAGALTGLARTTGALVVGTAAGAWAGRSLCSAVLPAGASMTTSVLVGASAAAAAAVVVLVVLIVGDRSVLVLFRGQESSADDAPAAERSSTAAPVEPAPAGTVQAAQTAGTEAGTSTSTSTSTGSSAAAGSALRVAHVLGSSAGGVARHVAQLSAAQAATGMLGRRCEVVVAGPSAVHALAVSSASVHAVTVEIADRPRPGDLAAVRALRGVARGADVVHAHGLRAGALAVVAARTVRRRPRVVVTLHNLPVGSRAVRAVSAVLERVVARGADAVLGVSSDLVERSRWLGARETARALVPAPPGRGVQAPRDEVRTALGLDASTRLVVTVGRLAVQKGLPTLADAAALLAAPRAAGELADGLADGSAPDGTLTDRRAADVLWVVAGGGPLAEVTQSRIDAELLPVRLLGPRDDALDLLAAADVVVSTAVWEGQPLGVQEALRVGAAVVATDAGGTREVTGDAALLVPVGDAAAVAAAVRGLLDDPDALADLRTRALAQARRLPTIADAVTDLARVYSRS